MLIIFRCLPGTGKSLLVKKLLEKGKHLLVLSGDGLRPRIIPRPAFCWEGKGLIDVPILVLADCLPR